MKTFEFDLFFGDLYGDQWGAIKTALAEEKSKIEIANDYLIDPASRLPVIALKIHPDHQVGDFCAAPGGKTLCMIDEGASPENLTLGELSPKRMARLKSNLVRGIGEAQASQIRFYTGDSARWGKSLGPRFDRALVDVPCSGERYLMVSGDWKNWTPGKSKRMSIRQHAILCSAFDALKTGGQLVYSTCSLSPFENDGVIEKLLKSRPLARSMRLSEDDFAPSEVEVAKYLCETRFGLLVRPDKGPHGFGPLFFAKIQKLESEVEPR